MEEEKSTHKRPTGDAYISAIEEAGELVAAITHYRRSNDPADEDMLFEEGWDAIVVIFYMLRHLNENKFKDAAIAAQRKSEERGHPDSAQVINVLMNLIETDIAEVDAEEHKEE